MPLMAKLFSCFLLVAAVVSASARRLECADLLEAVSLGDCPSDADLDRCDTEGLANGDLCEGDGECGTDDDLDNCEHNGAMQVAARVFFSSRGSEGERARDVGSDDRIRRFRRRTSIA